MRRRGAFVIPNPWDIGTAKLLASLGFKALATTSAGFAFSRGLPDGGVGFEAMIHHCREMAAATELPVSADLEKGKGDSPESAGETIFAAEAAGLAGCSIEDHTGDPERADLRFRPCRRACGRRRRRGALAEARFRLHRARRELSLEPPRPRRHDPPPAGLRARPAPTCSMRRASPTSTRCEAICTAVSKPVNVLVVPGFTVADLAEAGAKRISLGSKLATFVFGMLQTAAREMLQDGTFDFARAGMPFAKVQALFAKPRK